MTKQSGRYPPIGSYALLSDCKGAGLVSRDGSIDWLCLPRFDATPVFSRLLDWERGGFFRIGPASEAACERSYRRGTHVLDTRFRSPQGVLRITDCMVLESDDPEAAPSKLGGTPHRPRDQLIREVTCERGNVEIEVVFEPRFNYGATVPRILPDGEDLLLVYGGADALALQTEVPLEVVNHGSARGGTRLQEGDRRLFVLDYSLPHELRAERHGEDEIDRRLARTEEFWQGWSEGLRYEGRWEEAVRRSALVLKALTDIATGAVVAAPTTSLPEKIGGVRNWDYRYTWIRDAALVIDALFDLGFRSEARAFVDWLRRTTAGVPDELQIMYGPGGERLLPEVELEDVDGYRGSRPVRVGNAAYKQFQLDITGELVRIVWQHHLHDGDVPEDLWSFLRELVGFVEANWKRPDCGIWEVRSDPEHFVHSKALAWVAVDRAIKLAESLDAEADLDRWRDLRDAIRAEVLERGVDEKGRFLRAYEDDHADAAALLLPLLGFVEFDDPRVAATVEWIEEELAEDGLLHRYGTEAADGLEGGEGAFLLCTFWWVEVLARMGRAERARELFERLLSLRNDVGLLAEQADPETGELLGNYPQAFSHIGLIRAALALDDALDGAEPGGAESG